MPVSGPSYRLWRWWVSPLVFFQIYLSITVVLFFVGPWPWPVREPWLLAAFLVAAQLALTVGFLLAWHPAASQRRADGSRDIHILVSIAALLTLLFVVPTSMSRTGSWLPNVVRGYFDAGAAYNENFRRLQVGNAWVAVEYLRMLFSPILSALLLWLVAYWGRLSGRLKSLGVVAVLSSVALSVATGTNKGVADVLVILPWAVVLGMWRGTFTIRIPRPILAGGGVLAFGVFLDFFGRGQLQRAGGVGELGILNTGTELIQANRASGISTFLPDQLVVIYESLTRYLGQGYYALSMSFDIDWHSTLGFGNSMFLARNADAVFKTDAFTAGSLPGALEARMGWDMNALWHSIYPWIVSDVGFAGCLAVMIVLGWLLGAAWLDSLTVFHPAALALLAYLLIALYYIPANNQVMQSGESAVGFLISLAWWAASRRAWAEHSAAGGSQATGASRGAERLSGD